jgi:peptide/nickel transport system substrate-binding protein
MRLSRRSVLAAGAVLPFLRPSATFAAGPSTLTVGLSAYPSSFDPFLNVGAAAATVQQALHRGLLGYGPDGAVRGELAESWSNDSPTVWTFRLRDAVFHNGKPVTAEDVKWTVEQAAAEQSTAYMRAQVQQIARVEAVDARTVRMTTREPVVMLPLWFASYYLPIVSRDTTDRNQAIGAGPFVLKSAARGQSVEVAAFDRFYRPSLPKLAAIRFVAYPDENLRTAALQAGDVDLIDFVPWQAMQAIERDGKLVLDATEGPFMYLMFNFNTKPFGDPRVRLAVAHAIRREEVMQAAFFGRGVVLDGFPATKGSPFFEETYAHGWAYDQNKAKALLAEAGYANGFSCKLLSTSQYSMHQNTATVVQQHLGEIGIQVELVLPDWATRGDRGNKGQYDMAVQGTSWENTDPAGWATLLDGSLGPSTVRSYGMNLPRLTELFAAGQREFDLEKRKAIYREVQKITTEQTPIVSLLWRSQAFAYKRTLTGFKNLPGPLTQASGTTLEAASL